MPKDGCDNLSVVARSISKEVSLTQKLTDALIDKVVIDPNNQIEIINAIP